MTTFRNGIAALAIATSLLSSADAAIIDFSHYDGIASQASGVVGGVGVTAAAATWTLGAFDDASNTGTGEIDLYGPVFDTAVLHASRHGLALINSPIDDSHMIDGRGLRDVAILSFDRAVSLRSIGFNFVDANDDFVLFAGDSLSDLTTFSLQEAACQVSGLDLVGRVFGIGAFGPDDAFKITTMDVDAVPLPAAAPLFAAGIGFAAVARRRKRSA